MLKESTLLPKLEATVQKCISVKKSQSALTDQERRVKNCKSAANSRAKKKQKLWASNVKYKCIEKIYRQAFGTLEEKLPFPDLVETIPNNKKWGTRRSRTLEQQREYQREMARQCRARAKQREIQQRMEMAHLSAEICRKNSWDKKRLKEEIANILSPVNFVN